MLKHVKVIDGRIWLTKEGLPYFCGDLSAAEQQLVWSTQGTPAANIFAHDAPGVAWKSKPSWYIVGKKDHTVNPDLERFLAKRMKAKTTELDSSHVPMLSQPNRVIEVILSAAQSVKKSGSACGKNGGALAVAASARLRNTGDVRIWIQKSDVIRHQFEVAAFIRNVLRLPQEKAKYRGRVVVCAEG